MFLKYNVAGILWAALIFILCAIPGTSLPHYSWADLISFDKFIHAFIFAVLVLLLLRGFKKQNQFVFIAKHAILFSVTASVLYGGLLELMQAYCFTARSGDWFDFTANSVGCFAGIYVHHYFHSKQVKIFGVGF